MNKTELQQKIVDMEKQLAELKKELEKKDKGIWKPEEYKTFWYVGGDYNVRDEIANYDNFASRCLEFGNCYKTKQEAEKMANYLKYTNLLRKYVEEHSEPLVWENDNQKRYFMYYNYTPKRVDIDYDNCVRIQGTIYASSEEVLKDAISFLGEENIKRHIFGIEE